jgi:hypothetical protein
MRAWILVTGRQPTRGEHPSPKMLVDKLFNATVETVTDSHERDVQGRPVKLPPAAWYPVVRVLLERLA